MKNGEKHEHKYRWYGEKLTGWHNWYSQSSAEGERERERVWVRYAYTNIPIQRYDCSRYGLLHGLYDNADSE